jgi:acyl carrier protein
MTEQSIEDTLRTMMVERLFLKLKPEEIDLNANLMEAYGIDSVQVSELVVGTEAAFDITFEDDDFEPSRFDTLAHIAELVRTKLAK